MNGWEVVMMVSGIVILVCIPITFFNLFRAGHYMKHSLDYTSLEKDKHPWSWCSMCREDRGRKLRRE